MCGSYWGKKGLALGVLYLSAGRDPASVAWNDRLLGKLDGEIQELKDQGKDIMLMGDFNGHIGGNGAGGGGPQKSDRQGRTITEAWKGGV